MAENRETLHLQDLITSQRPYLQITIPRGAGEGGVGMQHGHPGEEDTNIQTVTITWTIATLPGEQGF